MKVSLNGIRQLNERYGCSGDVTAIGTEKLAERIGAQLGAIEEVINLDAKYQGIIIARVVECERHPNADKLSVCLIDDGGAAKNVERDDQGRIQVVCGAPNVRAGLAVAWLPPGTTVPDTVDKEPFVLEVREIRGVKSNGMLASPKELALGDSHEGILEIDGDKQPGEDFAQAFKLRGEVVFDIENKMFTHRPDCFGWLGVDRELAGIQQMPFKSPEWYVPNPQFPAPEGEELALQIHNELPELVPRFTAITMRNVAVGTSPVWLQVALAKVGQRSINNIVDLTNFCMLETGQPLHAYDYDKVKALSNNEATIVIRHPKEGESVSLLNRKEIKPRAEAIMIATDKVLIGVGGIMGGADTEVDEGTKNIIIECANFDMYSVRRTSMAHGLFTDAVTRFTKGQSPLQNLAVLAKMVSDVQRLAGGSVGGRVIDDNHIAAATLERNAVHPPVKVTASFINDRLGLHLGAAEMTKLLENVECKVEVKDDELTVTAPFWRTDIELREDVVEEIGRLYGYDHLPLQLPDRVIAPVAKDLLLEAKRQIRDQLRRAGANEVLSYSFVHGDLLAKVGQSPDQAFQLANALSPDLQHYRISLMPSLLEKVHANIKAGYDEFALFELGKVHDLAHKDGDGLPQEFEYTALVVSAADKAKKRGDAYYQARYYLTTLLGEGLEFKPLGQEVLATAVARPYAPARAALVSTVQGEFLGIVGEFKPSVSRALKLPRYTAGFELDTEVVARLLRQAHTYVPLPRYPKVTQDISLKVSRETSYQTLYTYLAAKLATLEPKNVLSTLEPLDIYQATDESGNTHFTFRLCIACYDRTLTDKEVNIMLDGLAAAAKDEFGAERI